MVSGARGQEAQLAALAAHAQLGFGEQHVVRIQSQHFGGAQSVHEHQAHDGQVARGAEAGPKARHLIHGERDDVGAWALLLAAGLSLTSAGPGPAVRAAG